MNRYWAAVTKPLLEAADARVVLEIGAEAGLQTHRLLDFCAARGACAHVIDPMPEFDVEEWEREYGTALAFHRARSLDVIGDIPPVDVALIDGDHNWYTVFHELQALERRALEEGRLPPVVALHDVGWPYGRRDLYYDPESIPAEHRHPFTQAGLEPGRSEPLDAGGLNPHLQHALHEGSERNGVLTALEDFVADSDEGYSVVRLSALSGLAVVVPDRRVADAPTLGELITWLGSAPFQADQVRMVERERLRAGIRAGVARGHADQLRARVAKAERGLNESDARLGEAEAHRSELERRVSELRADVFERDVRLAEADARRHQLERRVTELEAEIRQAERDAVVAAREHEVELTRYEAEREHHESERERHESERERHESERKHHEAERVRYEVELARHELESERFEAELDRRKAERNRREAARERLVQRVDRQRQALARVQAGQASAAINVRRAAEGQAWRVGHRLALLFRWLTFRPPASRETALDVALRSLPDPSLEAGGSNPLFELADELAATEEALRAMAETEPGAPPLPRVARRLPSQAIPAGAGTDLAAAVAREGLARSLFEARYDQILRDVQREPGEGELGEVVAQDRRGLLRAAGEPQAPDAPTVDIVVAVRDALEHVRACLFSLLEKGDRPFRLIVVDDGSGPATAAFLRSFARRHPSVTLVRNGDAPHGYTIAANLGLRASTGDYVVLLNSDTVVTPGWLEKIVACGESSDRIGLVGPVGNAASHQSVPLVRVEGRWATNDLPPWLHPDAVALAVGHLSGAARPRLPFLNGFCLAIKRAAIDQVGLFDEDNFAAGYCEENDFAFRASEAGLELAVADDSYVLHRKSRSYTDAGRASLAKAHYDRFLEKHGASKVEARVRKLEASTELQPLRELLAPLTESEDSFQKAFAPLLSEPLRVLFVLPGMSRGSSGGAHSIYQEVKGMRALGIPARVALASSGWKHARAAYSDVDEVFVPFRDAAELEQVAAEYEVLVATHFRSVDLVARIVGDSGKLSAYYVQDYEPFFAEEGSADAEEARNSYTALPNGIRFAKTHWLCDLVSASHGVRVAKVEPSLDHEVYRPAKKSGEEGGPVRVIAMVRPRTTRRQPVATVAVLERVAAELGSEVEVTVFGCDDRELARISPGGGSGLRNLGVLTREGVARALARSDLFLDASTYQAFGRTALEAMACGCTCVLPSVGGVREFARDGENALIVDTTDLDAVCGAIAGLTADRPRLERLRAAALRTAQDFSVSRAALSEYLLLEREYRRRVSGAESATAAATPPPPAGEAPRESPASSTPAG